MIVTYTPEGEEVRRWEFDAADLTAGEAEDVEEALGIPFDDWQYNLHRGYAKARRGLLWLMLRREQPDLRFDALREIRLGDLAVEYSREEEDRVLAQLERDKDVSDEDVATVRKAFGRDSDDDGEAGKADSIPARPTGTGG